jgi:hypothetical protein
MTAFAFLPIIALEVQGEEKVFLPSFRSGKQRCIARAIPVPSQDDENLGI